MTSAIAEYRGIEGVEGSEPVGAVLTIGRKGPSGAPVETDRFFLVVPTMGADGRRDAHSEFAPFNGAAVERRQVIHGNLVHAEEADCFDWHLKAQVLPRPYVAHPDKRPACVGDGDRATRYDPGGVLGPPTEDGFREIVCPNDLCEFRQGAGVKPCKPWGRLYFRVRWVAGSPLPSPLVKWATGSWNSVRAVVGFFEHVRAQAAGLGLEEFSLYGLPFSLTLSRKTKPSAKSAFPVVSVSPECDLIAFFLQQREQIRQLGGTPEIKLIAGARSPEENEPGEVYLDHATITPGRVTKPASVLAEEGQTEPAEDAQGNRISVSTIDEGAEGGAEVEPRDDPGADERWRLLQAQARGLKLKDSDLEHIVGELTDGGLFVDLDPAQDAEVIRRLQAIARKRG